MAENDQSGSMVILYHDAMAQNADFPEFHILYHGFAAENAYSQQQSVLCQTPWQRTPKYAIELFSATGAFSVSATGLDHRSAGDLQQRTSVSHQSERTLPTET